MKYSFLWMGVVGIILGGAWYFWSHQSVEQLLVVGPGTQEALEQVGIDEKSQKIHDMIRVELPKKNSAVTSPLMIAGKARGMWYFEGSFPIFLMTSTGVQIAQGVAEAQSDWMTEDYVDFVIQLPFPTQPA